MTLERQEEIRQTRLKNSAAMNTFLGATMQGLYVKWWPPINKPPSNVVATKASIVPGRFWAGIRFWNRDLHWDRRSRYGEN